MMRRLLALGTMIAVAAPAPVSAADLKIADSVRIGSGGVLCTAQNRVADPVLASMFDRGYRITCRDAAAPVGKLFALRLGKSPRAVVTTTPETGLWAARSARSTAWPMAWAASSMLMIAPPLTPLDWTWLAPATRIVRSA